MLHWAATFFVNAIVALIFGFTGVAGLSMQIAWILFLMFVVFAILAFVFGRRPAG